MSLVIENARVVTGRPDTPAIAHANVLVEGSTIAAVQTTPVDAYAGARVLDAGGQVLMPGFVDAHTHAMWAGDRLDEFASKQQGASYLDILRAGGGIMSTVRAVRRASQEALARELRQRLDRMLWAGTTTVEVKSGYGLTTRDELKMLAAIAQASQGFAGTVVPTALLGHAIDAEQGRFVDRVIGETLPAVHAAHPHVAVDAYCESGAWSPSDCRRLFVRAIELGHPVRVHADQFTSLGMIPLALELGARSVDHLEASTEGDLQLLASSPTYGVMLPITGFCLDGRYADGRTFLDRGGKLVLATNYNPGSAPSFSMPFAIALAVRFLALTPVEAMVASTSTAASLLGLRDRGRVEAGKRADLVLLRHRDERMLACEAGTDPVQMVICNGRVVVEKDLL